MEDTKSPPLYKHLDLSKFKTDLIEPPRDNLVDEVTKKFMSQVCEAKEKLAIRLIAAGYTPANVQLVERTWFDHDAQRMMYECHPLHKDVILPTK